MDNATILLYKVAGKFVFIIRDQDSFERSFISHFRVDELENQLQQVKEIVEINSEPEDRSTDGELSAEHRLVL